MKTSKFILPFLLFWFIFLSANAFEKEIIIKKGDNITQICKKYEIKKNDLLAFNHLKSDNLKIGSKLQIPYKIPEVIIVGKGDNLLSISKKFGVPKSDLIKFNDLKDEKIKIGQKLYLKAFLFTKKDYTESNSPLIIRVPINENNINRYDSSKVNHYKMITIHEKVVANYIEDDNLIKNKSIALHKSAKDGTIIKIKNLLNGRTESVKVIGRISKGRFQEEIGIQITKSIAKKLGVVDQFFRAELTYIEKIEIKK